MTMAYRLQVEHHSPARPEQLWSVLSDWEGQHRWIPLTSVRVLEGDGSQVGDLVEAVSRPGWGERRRGLVDRMRVTRTVPGYLLEVEHLGPFFRGLGRFTLVSDGQGTRITSLEEVSGPAPAVALAPLSGPALRVGLRGSLRSLSELAGRVSV
ncbi:SRPBCC family protein [Desertihabitans brevis]|uniref:SRPBCC family protein n=2 Tax=Desertihabitans brevis TaxID=2268447 RepID=A0A367YSA9_9ACTN|nr:SRPBCC family protein [Desertihabitans brevis]